MDNPSRRPVPAQNHPRDPLFIPPDEETIRTIARKIWNPYHGHGTLIGCFGHPPLFAHVAHYPSRPEELRDTPQHSAAFFVLN